MVMRRTGYVTTPSHTTSRWEFLFSGMVTEYQRHVNRSSLLVWFAVFLPVWYCLCLFLRLSNLVVFGDKSFALWQKKCLLNMKLFLNETFKGRYWQLRFGKSFCIIHCFLKEVRLGWKSTTTGLENGCISVKIQRAKYVIPFIASG